MGLLRTAARATVAASVVGRVQRRQHKRWAAEDAAAAAAAAPPAAAHPVAAAPIAAPPVAPPPLVAPAPVAAAAAPAASAGDDTGAMLEQLGKLGQLRDAGVLTEAEFEAQKQRILTGRS
ncbi:MAG: SHOCT domain-containing protein [Propionibacterium sp.]|nr:SHOCT domain-containing protein [Propionibacterium sp.]